MRNDPSNYRRIRVNVDLGAKQSYVTVLTETVLRGQRRTNLVWRGVLPGTPGVSTGAEILALARTALDEATGRL